MPAQKLLPDRGTLARLRGKGVTYGEIADRYGVTEAAVYQALQKGGLIKRTRVSHKALMPWRIRPEHAHAHVALMLRCLSLRTQGQPLASTERIANSRASMLDRWLAQLAELDYVVCYDPDMPANPASESGGWFYQPRTPEDGASVIREAHGLPALA